MKAYCNYLIIKVKNSYTYLNLLNNYFLLVIGLTLMLLGFNSKIYLVLLGLYLIYLIKQSKYVFIFLLVIMGLVFGHYRMLESKSEFNSNDIIGIVKEVKEKDTYNQVTVENEDYKVIVYDGKKLSLKAGMKVYVAGERINIDPNRIEYGFNYNKYLKHHHYDGVINSSDIVVLGKVFCIEVIKEKVFNYFEVNFSKDTLVFMKALVLGDDDHFTDEFNESLKINGIIHLFAISGSHITLFVVLLGYIFDKLKIKQSTQNIIIVMFLLFYLIITSFNKIKITFYFSRYC